MQITQQNTQLHIIRQLSHRPRLVRLELSACRLGDVATYMLGSALRSLPELRHLDLKINRIRFTGALGLARGLRDHLSLRTLILASNGIPDAGAEALLESGAPLSYLDLAVNPIRNKLALRERYAPQFSTLYV
ncbi:MAG: hypothetical protein S4CHLAM2_08160 [Chlamydiales bacterium]|nr:hypothetical protein [Chlamydiales bacterium]